MPDLQALGSATGVVVTTPPRFEDAFVDLLGGGPKYESPLGQTPDELLPDGVPVVEAIGLTKQFGSFTAAQNISFRIAGVKSTACWGRTERANRRRSK